MIDEYFKIYKETQQEYGEKSTVIIVCGQFYEIYSVDNEKEQIGNGKKVSEIILCDFTNKNKAKKAKEGFSTRANPDFVGFQVGSLCKFLPPLLNAGYTVVEVGQLEDAKSKKGRIIKRGIVNVHSPTLKSPEYSPELDVAKTDE